MVIINEAWLKLTKEEPIDSELPICDAHHHLWDNLDAQALSWKPVSKYLTEDLLLDIAGNHNVLNTVFIEAGSSYRNHGPVEMQPVGETEFVVSAVATKGFKPGRATNIAAGIVGFADLCLGNSVAPVIEAHIEAGKGRFRGVRYTCTWNANPEIRSRASSTLLRETKFKEGFACLKKFGLSFDAWLYHTQLLDLADLARFFSSTPIILNHIGGIIGTGPYKGKREEVMQEWKKGMVELAKCDNVFIKLGGLGLPVFGYNWNKQPKPPDSVELAQVMAPYFLWSIEKFGVDRCMFESNFPADKISYDYSVIWNAFKRITQKFSYSERCSLFYNTAALVYRLPKLRASGKDST